MCLISVCSECGIERNRIEALESELAKHQSLSSGVILQLKCDLEEEQEYGAKVDTEIGLMKDSMGNLELSLAQQQEEC